MVECFSGRSHCLLLRLLAGLLKRLGWSPVDLICLVVHALKLLTLLAAALQQGHGEFPVGMCERHQVSRLQRLANSLFVNNWRDMVPW